MTPSSPTPPRRRRPQSPPYASGTPHRSNPLDHLEAPSSQPSGVRQSEAVPSRPQRSAPRSSSNRARHGSLLERITTPVRLLLIAVCVAIFVFCAVGITHSYLERQEERRRLEAEAAERAQHPLEFAGLITQYALAQDLDPALVSAVILCESSFNPQAESRLGARGLMQLMEDTAAWVAHKLREDDASYSFDRLYDAETSIRFGTWYLGYLSRRFGGDAKKIVCAYHAGQGNVDAWLNNPDYSSDGVTLDVIPTQDTAAYASRVLRARDVYRKYYFPAPTPTPVNP